MRSLILSALLLVGCGGRETEGTTARFTVRLTNTDRGCEVWGFVEPGQVAFRGVHVDAPSSFSAGHGVSFVYPHVDSEPVEAQAGAPVRLHLALVLDSTGQRVDLEPVELVAQDGTVSVEVGDGAPRAHWQQATELR